VKKSAVYYIQNKVIHEACRQLEDAGTLNPWDGVNQIRLMAARLNLGIASISRLSLEQREALIDRLKGMGAEVRNPHIYDSDLRAEHAASGSKAPRKCVLFSEPNEDQLGMLDTLAARVKWRETDGYPGFCHKLIKSPRALNFRHATNLRLALQSIIGQQVATSIYNPRVRSSLFD
jgi:hypothetical protein